LDNSSQSKDPDENKKSSNSGSGSGSSGSSKKKESSGMSTGAVIGIIGGVVAAIGAIAFIIIAAIRKHRDEGDDDPLSPLEIMDKGQVVSQYGREAPRTYVSNNTPPGTYSTNYSQLYSTKNATSPQSHNSIKRATATLAPQRSQMPRNVDIDVDNNLWLSAMEQPHAATTAGAGAVALKNRSSNTDARSFHTSNSYDDLDRARNPTDAMSSNSYQSAAIDDASSLMSGQSDYTNNEFPEYDENRAIVRGSYEL
jgi:cytoskeletal protein RodZ